MHFSMHSPRKDGRERARMELPPESSLTEIIDRNIRNVQEAACRDRESLSQILPKSDPMLPYSPSKLAKIINEFGLSFDPHPSSSINNRCSILKHFPGELLIIIVQHCQHKDLRNLCLVSKHMESIARPEVYRTVVISTNKSLIGFCRTIEEEPTFGKFIKELKFLASVEAFSCTRSLYPTAKGGFALAVLWSLCLETLKRSTNLRRLTMVLVGEPTGPYPSSLIWETRSEDVDSLWKVATQSPGCGSTTVILPRLEQVRLISDTRSQDPDLRLTHPQILKPFLHLPSLSHLEFLNDSGVWSRIYCFLDQRFHPTMFDKHNYRQIKSVVLRESDCCPTAIVHILDTFPATEVFFLQNRLEKSSRGKEIAAHSSLKFSKSNLPEKPYLPALLAVAEKLKALALVTIGDEDWAENVMRVFLGPYGFLNLTNLRHLESLSALITLFTSPDGDTTGLLTVSPVEVLPTSLNTLSIIVDYEGLVGEIPLNEIWFQPREAALQFLEELAGVCSRAFPNLRKVEYIWAVDRTTDNYETGDMSLLNAHSPKDPESSTQTWDCDGSVPLCCDIHTAIQALSPDVDYSSRAEGIVSPFKQRFDDLDAAFKDVNVGFQIVELERYSDYFFHWRGERD